MESKIQKSDYVECDDSYDYRRGPAIEDENNGTVRVRWSNGDKETIEVDGVDFVASA